MGAFHYGVHQDRNRHLWSAEVTDQSNPAVMTGESGDCGRKLTVAEQFWDDEVVIWKSNQSFKKTDPRADVLPSLAHRNSLNQHIQHGNKSPERHGWTWLLAGSGCSRNTSELCRVGSEELLQSLRPASLWKRRRRHGSHSPAYGDTSPEQSYWRLESAWP